MKPGSENLSAEIVRLVRKGEAMIESGESNGALDLLYRALFLDPRNARIINDIGVALLLVGRSDEAEEVFRVAVDVDPQNQAALENLIAVSGRHAAAVDPDEPLGDPEDDGFEISGVELAPFLELPDDGFEACSERMHAAARYELLASRLTPECRCLVIDSVERDGVKRLRSASRRIEWRSFRSLSGADRETQDPYDAILFAEPLRGGRCVEAAIHCAARHLGPGGALGLVLAHDLELDGILEATCRETGLMIEGRFRQGCDGGFPTDALGSDEGVEIAFLRRGSAVSSPRAPVPRTALVLRRSTDHEGRDPDRRMASILRGMGFRVIVTAAGGSPDSVVAARIAADAPDLVVAPLDGVRDVAAWITASARAEIPVIALERCGADRLRIELLTSTGRWRPRRRDLAALPLEDRLAERLRTTYLRHKGEKGQTVASGIGLVLGGLGAAAERIEELPEAHGRVREWWRVTSRRDDNGAHRLVALRIGSGHGAGRDPLELLELADVAVTDESPLGLFVAARSRPLVVTGRPSYAAFGFTRAAGAEDLLSSVVSAIECESLSERESRKRDRFLYHLLFEVTVEDSREDLRGVLALRLEECGLAVRPRRG